MLFYLGALQVKNEIQFSQIFFLRTELDKLELVKFACFGSVLGSRQFLSVLFIQTLAQRRYFKPSPLSYEFVYLNEIICVA